VQDLVWGADISTRGIAVAEWLIDDDTLYAVRVHYRVLRPAKLAAVWPRYLLEVGDLVSELVSSRPAIFHPVVLGVEQPVGKPNPHLMAAWGVAIEHFVTLLPQTLIWDMTPSVWRKEVGLTNRIAKSELVGEARDVGYAGVDDNEAEACLIARATARRWRRSGRSAAPTAGAS
jgi:hypothetical protein